MLKVEEMAEALPRLQASGNSSNQLIDKSKEEEKIWTRILSDVTAKSNTGLQSAVILLGDHKCGNHTLLEKMEKDKADKGTFASALEYHTLHVQADFRDGSYAYQLGSAGALGPAESMTLPVWLVDGDDTFSPLLTHALPPSSPSRAVIVLTVSIDNPGMMHSLRRWDEVISREISSKYDKTALEEARSTQERFWQEYMDPSESSMSASIMQGMEDTMVVPLEQGVLSENSGASMVVVVTKSDLAPEMSTAQWEKLVVQVRRFCLSHGAALFFVSAKKGHNLTQLYKYIVHRAYGIGFTSPAQVMDRETVFVPAGWDSEKKIEIIKESTAGDIDTLEPTRDKPAIKEQLIEAEEEQSFLTRLMSMEAAPVMKKQPSTMVEDGADSTGVLSSFFSNLLKPQPGKPSPTSAASAAPLDAAAQLDRIRQSATPTKPPTESSA